MTTQQMSDPSVQERAPKQTTLRRRGVIAGAAALAAGLLAKQTTQTVAAAYNFQGDTGNAAAATTSLSGNVGGTLLTLSNTNGVSSGANGLDASASAGVALHGTSAQNIGVEGSSVATIGVRGTFSNASAANGVGVKGVNDSTGLNSFGVHGTALNGIGVQGTSANGTGVQGVSTGQVGVHGTSASQVGVLGEIVSASSVNNTSAIIGKNLSTGTGGIGVIGISNSATGVAVKGQSLNGTGVLGVSSGAGNVAGVMGTSTTTYGVIGSTTASGFSGLTAITSTAGVAALAATSTVSTGYAAYFTGKTVVQGDFFVVSGSKSAAVPHADGSHRAVYCVESPESWFEDFGKSKLVGGKAEVRLDPEFAAIVHANDYLVFLTATGPSQGLDVVSQDASRFSVQERNKGTGNITFSWRVVAKRKDIAGTRLAKVDLPKIHTPDLARLPKP